VDGEVDCAIWVVHKIVAAPQPPAVNIDHDPRPRRFDECRRDIAPTILQPTEEGIGMSACLFANLLCQCTAHDAQLRIALNFLDQRRQSIKVIKRAFGRPKKSPAVEVAL